MVKQTQPIEPQVQPIEEPTSIEPKQETKAQKQEIVAPKQLIQQTSIKFDFTKDTLANEEDMSQVRDILQTGEQQQEELFHPDLMFLSVEEVARFLELAYDIQGMVTYKDLWKREKSFFYEIAEGILPHLNNWAMRVPALGHAIKTGSAAGSWGRLILDLGGTWIFVYKRKQLEAEKKKEEEENGGTKVDYSQQQTHIKPAGPHFIP